MLGKALSHDDNLQFKHMLAPRQGVHDSWSFRPMVIFFKEHTLSLLLPVEATAPRPGVPGVVVLAGALMPGAGVGTAPEGRREPASCRPWILSDGCMIYPEDQREQWGAGGG